jgi:dihydroxyacetone kinase-like predicted kinase
VITPGLKDIDALLASANRAAKSVIGGEITAAVRDAVIDGVSIRCGQYMGICDGSIRVASETAEEAVKELLDTVDMDLSEIITLFVGRSVSDESRAALTEELEDRYPDCEIVVYEGGQDVYDYYLAVE